MSLDDLTPIPMRSLGDLTKRARDGWIYRGQREAEWPLATAFQRCCEDNRIRHRLKFEDGLIREFQRAYHLYASSPPDKDAYLEWLALMQHHGAPTRLLDFTYSIEVATYFAVECACEPGTGDPPRNEERCDDAAVWGVDAKWATRESRDVLDKAGRDPKLVEELARPLWQDLDEEAFRGLFRSEEPVAFACPVNPFRLNERLHTQRGVFLAAGDIQRPFAKNLEALDKHDSREYVKKFIIPGTKRRDILKGLFNMNISRRSLFPGLDGYARTLGVYHPVFNTVR